MATSLKMNDNIIALLALVGLFGTCVFFSYLLSAQDAYIAIGAVLGITFFAIGFLSPRTSLYILIFSMLLSPEFGARGTGGEGLTIRFEDMLLLVMGFAWLAKTAVHKQIGLAVHTQLNRPILYYILACSFSTLWGIILGNVRSPLTGIMFVMKYIEYFVIFFLTINNIQSKKHLKSLLWSMFIVYVIVIIVGFSQIPGGGRITAPFEGEQGEPNTLGGYLVLMLSLNITLFLNIKRRVHKLALGTLAAISFVGILYTLSRASWLAAFAMYFALIYLSKQRKFLVLMLVIGTVLAPFTMPDEVIDRVLYTFSKDRDEPLFTEAELEFMRDELNVNYDTSTLARFGQMKNVFRDFQNHPVVGYGVTGYQFIDAQYHRVLIETGMFGLVTFLLLLYTVGKVLKANIRSYTDDPLYATISVGTFCAFIGLVAHGIGTNTFIIVRIMEPFWCLVALNVAIPMIEKGEIDHDKAVTEA